MRQDFNFPHSTQEKTKPRRGYIIFLWSCNGHANQQSKKEKKKSDEEKTLIYSICQCLWCKYFYHDRVQAVDRNMKSRNSELGRFMCKWLSCAGLSTPQFVSGTTRMQTQTAWLPKHVLNAQNSSSSSHNLQNTCDRRFM